MNTYQHLIIIALCALATQLTRFLPFILFPAGKPTPKFIQYLGHALPAAVFSMLVVYCLKSVSITGGSHGLPEAIAIAAVAVLHLWKKPNVQGFGLLLAVMLIALRRWVRFPEVWICVGRLGSRKNR